MGFRVVFIENEVNIKIKLDNLIVTKEGQDLWIPVEDISVLVVDNLQITLTARMLCALAEHNVGVIFCNQKHHPIGYYSSYDNHSRISKMIGFQIEKNAEFYDLLWKNIVQAKIENQAQVLEILGKRQEIADALRIFSREVQPGDVHNREAHAAKLYFNELMGTSFSRGNEDILLNAGLDYGYSIFRSFLAKICVGYGLNSQLGIHHRNEFNRFNLVDDMIEPFRPLVDMYVYKLLDGEEYFQPEHRHKIVNLLNHKMIFRDKSMYLCNAMEEYVSCIAAYISNRKFDVIMPAVADYQGEEYEV